MGQDSDHLFDECRDFLKKRLEDEGVNFVLLLVNEETRAIEVMGDLGPEMLREVLMDTLASLEVMLKEGEHVQTDL